MFNKNLVIGLIAIVLVGGGIAYFSSHSNPPIPNTSVSERGVKNLTPDVAARMIEVFLTTKLPYVQHIAYDTKSGHFVSNVGIPVVGPTNDTVKTMEKAGFVKIITPDPLGTQYDFTDAGKPYLFADDKDPNFQYLTLGKLTSIKVTALTEPTDSERGKLIWTNTEETYEVYPIGVAVRSGELRTTFARKVSFILYQDGWRVEETSF